MDLPTMRDLVRRDLKDEDPLDERWTDDELDRAIQRAVSEFSTRIPREMKNTIATVDGSREIDVSSLTDRVSVDAVELPVDEHPRVFQRFALYQDTITLTGDREGDGEDCYIFWSKAHTLDAGTSTIPTQFEALAALGASAYAAISASVYSTNRVTIGGSNVDRDYHYWGRGRLMEFQKELKRLSPKRKLRVGRFYAED